MPDRLQQLLTMLQKEPNDPFLLYGAAMEYKKQGDMPTALDYFRRALTADPGYCYAYYQMGQVHESAGDTAAAKAIYRDGISAAQNKGDHHAAQEIAAALEALDI
jgi:tetratricopeptide (TPR) repeat protein